MVIRRISVDYHLVDDENTGQRRISSKAYSASNGENGGMSVDLEALILAEGLEPKEWVTSPRFMGSVSFKASEIRGLNLLIGFHPISASTEESANPFHGEVWNTTEARRFTKSQSKKLAEAAQWYVELEGVAIK